jgi:hypothetical protein
MAGDIVVYKKNGVITHYAVVTMVDANGNITEIESKWGRGQLFKGPVDAVPADYGAMDGTWRRK